MSWGEIARGLSGIGGVLTELAVVSGLLGKLGKFTNQLKVESEFGTEMAEREIRGEDRNIASNISPLSFKQATQSSETTTDSIKNDIDNILLNF